MPTPMEAFALVASTLSGIDPEDDAAVKRFYETTFAGYPVAARELVADFLIGQTDVPANDALRKLKRQVDKMHHTRTF